MRTAKEFSFCEKHIFFAKSEHPKNAFIFGERKKFAVNGKLLILRQFALKNQTSDAVLPTNLSCQPGGVKSLVDLGLKAGRQSHRKSRKIKNAQFRKIKV